MSGLDPIPHLSCAEAAKLEVWIPGCDPCAPRPVLVDWSQEQVFRQARTIGARISIVTEMVEHSQI